LKGDRSKKKKGGRIGPSKKDKCHPKKIGRRGNLKVTEELLAIQLRGKQIGQKEEHG